MTIKQFDSNGLIFILDEKAARISESGTLDYVHAVKNVLSSQGFSCIPLVDAPRIRRNTNDLTSRPRYEPNGGAVTGYARLGFKSLNEEEVVFFSPEQIPHISEESTLAEAVCMLFKPSQNGTFPMMVSVGGTPGHPLAIFSEQQLLEPRTKAELYRQLSWFSQTKIGKRIEDIDRYPSKFYLNISERPYLHSKELMLKFSGKIEEVFSKLEESQPEENLPSEYIRSAPKYYEQRFGALVVGDVMQHACVGIQWECGLIRIREQPQSNRIAKKILCDANDFSHLAVYDERRNLLPYVIGSTWDLERPATIVNSHDMIQDVVRSEMVMDGRFVAIVRPDENLMTGEGRMVWPGILTKQELLSDVSLLNAFAISSVIELKLKNEIKSLNLHKSTEEEKRKENKDWNWLDDGTFGKVVAIIRENKERSFRGVFKNFHKKQTIRELESIRKMRNSLAHGGLSIIDDPNHVVKDVDVEKFVHLYNVRRQLFR